MSVSPVTPVVFDDSTEGAYHIARYWLYDHPHSEIPDREARVIARELIRLVNQVGSQEPEPFV